MPFPPPGTTYSTGTATITASGDQTWVGVSPGDVVGSGVPGIAFNAGVPALTCDPSSVPLTLGPGQYLTFTYTVGWAFSATLGGPPPPSNIDFVNGFRAIIGGIPQPPVVQDLLIAPNASGSDSSGTGGSGDFNQYEPVFPSPGLGVWTFSFTLSMAAVYTVHGTAPPDTTTVPMPAASSPGVPTGPGGRPGLLAPSPAQNPSGVAYPGGIVGFYRGGTLNWHRSLTYGNRMAWTALNRGQGQGLSWFGGYPWFLPPGVTQGYS